jgi:hypothetical protein
MAGRFAIIWALLCATITVEELVELEGHIDSKGDEDEMDGAETGSKEEYIEEAEGEEYTWDN